MIARDPAIHTPPGMEQPLLVARAMSKFLPSIRQTLSPFALSLPLLAIACGGTTSSNAPSGDGGGEGGSAAARSAGGNDLSDGGIADGNGKSDTGPTSPKPAFQSCPSVTEDICRRAAACSSAGAVVLAYTYQGQVVATEEHGSESECATYYRALGCNDFKVDLDACADALTTSTCVSSTKGEALAMPQACSKQ